MKKETVIELLEKMAARHKEEDEKEGTSHTGFYRRGALDATVWAIELVKAIDSED
jgi:hypothetical protein